MPTTRRSLSNLIDEFEGDIRKGDGDLTPAVEEEVASDEDRGSGGTAAPFIFTHRRRASAFVVAPDLPHGSDGSLENGWKMLHTSFGDGIFFLGSGTPFLSDGGTDAESVIIHFFSIEKMGT